MCFKACSLSCGFCCQSQSQITETNLQAHARYKPVDFNVLAPLSESLGGAGFPATTTVLSSMTTPAHTVPKPSPYLGEEMKGLPRRRVICKSWRPRSSCVSTLIPGSIGADAQQEGWVSHAVEWQAQVCMGRLELALKRVLNEADAVRVAQERACSSSGLVSGRQGLTSCNPHLPQKLHEVLCASVRAMITHLRTRSRMRSPLDTFRSARLDQRQELVRSTS